MVESAALRCAVKAHARRTARRPLGFSTPVAGVTTFELEDKNGQTTVHVSHRAIGEITEEQVAGYGRGWQRLMQTDLPDWVERGERFKPDET